ncbi:MAG: four helix bundle protein [Bacteroidota bacterium]
MHNYKELKVWQKARELVKFIYNLSSKFPKEETYGLTLQMRKAVVSISSNISEGSGHSSKREFIRFLEISYSSSCELDTQLILSHDLDFIIEKELNEGSDRIIEVQKMLNGLMKSLHQ